MRIISLNIGKPVILSNGDQKVDSAIEKHPMTGEIYLSKLNLDGDLQADQVNHGGPDKALCVYPFDHYSYWSEEFGVTFSYPAFGENLTVEHWTEDITCVGDIYQIGDAVVQVSQPRKPCYKLALKHGIQNIVDKVVHTGFTGFYLRVLQEGMISKECQVTLLKRHPLNITISRVNQARYSPKVDHAEIQAVLAVQELSDAWRIPLQNKLGV